MNLRTLHITDELDGRRALAFADDLTGTHVDNVSGFDISLRDVTHIDVSGVAVLVRIYSRLEERGKTLRLSDVPTTVAGLLQRLGVDDLLTPAPRRRSRWTPVRAFRAVREAA